MEGLIEDVTQEMAKEPSNIEPDEYWGVAVPCNLELLCLLAKQKWVGVELPEAETIAKWKATYLAVWDAKIDGLVPKPDYETKRRAVLVATFDDLEALARADEDEGEDGDDDEPTAAKAKPKPAAKASAKPAAKEKASAKPKAKKKAPAKRTRRA